MAGELAKAKDEEVGKMVVGENEGLHLVSRTKEPSGGSGIRLRIVLRHAWSSSVFCILYFVFLTFCN